MIPIVVSTGQSKNPVKRELEEAVIAELDKRPEYEVVVIPNLYDLSPKGDSMSTLQGFQGDLIIFTWLYQRSAHWILDRHGIHGKLGDVQLQADDEEEDEDDEAAASGTEEETDAEDIPRVIDQRPVSDRTIYCLDFRTSETVSDFVDEVQRIAGEITGQDLDQWIQGAPTEQQQARYEQPQNDTAMGPATQAGNAVRIEEAAGRRWYPVIDFSRCTNCMECIDFCLFGVYGVDQSETILVEQPDNCRKGCPACSRVCPENAIVFPQHKTPAIAGAAADNEGFKIDLSLLFGQPDAADVAAQERDEQLVLAGRQPVEETPILAKRQVDTQASNPDSLDELIDGLDTLDL